MLLSMIMMTVKGLLLLVAAVYGFAFLLRTEDATWVKKAPLAILLSMFFIGMWGHIYWSAYAALLLALPLLAKDRADGAALYCILIVSMPLLSQQLSIGSLYLIPTNKYLFCALGLAIVFMLKRDNRAPARRLSHFGLPIFLITLLEIAQLRDPSITAMIRQSIPVLLTIPLPYFLISRALRSANDVRRFLLAFTMSGFVMAVVATAEARLHWLIYRQIEGLLQIQMSVNGYSKLRAGLIRAPASFPESTTLAIFLVLAIMAAFATRSSFASKGKWWVVLSVLGLGLISANSRSAFLVLPLGLVAWDFYRRRYGALAIKVVGAAGVYVLALFAAQFSAFFAAMVGQDSGTASTSDYRVQLLHRGMEEIRKHPIFGQNLKSALDNLQDLRQGEGIIDLVNGYINYGLVSGYPGMVALGLAFISLCIAMLVARAKLQRNVMQVEAAACVFAVAALSAVSCFFSGFGGPVSTSYYQMCAVGSAIWAMRAMAPAVRGAAGAPAAPALSGIAALIAADRNRAKALATAPSAAVGEG